MVIFEHDDYIRFGNGVRPSGLGSNLVSLRLMENVQGNNGFCLKSRILPDNWSSYAQR